jgi:Acetyltransferases
MNIIYKNIITADEVNSIRASVGFRKIHPEQVQAGLEGSSYIISAYDEDRVIGMARLIWDNGTVALIKDILVVPEYQMQGIDTEMITRIFDFLRAKLKPGFGIQVDVNAWNNQEQFYEDLGFQVSTPQRRGVPMHICLTNQIELTDTMFKQCELSTPKDPTKC